MHWLSKADKRVKDVAYEVYGMDVFVEIDNNQ